MTAQRKIWIPQPLRQGACCLEGEARIGSSLPRASLKTAPLRSRRGRASDFTHRSHMLRAPGVSDELARSSLRFGLGRFNPAEEADFAVLTVAGAVPRLRGLAPSPSA